MHRLCILNYKNFRNRRYDIEKVNCPKLNVQDKEICFKLPTLTECKDAVFNMKTNKSWVKMVSLVSFVNAFGIL